MSYPQTFCELLKDWIDENLQMSSMQLTRRLNEEQFKYTHEIIQGYLSGSRKPPGAFFAHLIICFSSGLTSSELNKWRTIVNGWIRALGTVFTEELVTRVSIGEEIYTRYGKKINPENRIGDGWEELERQYVEDLMEDFEREMKKYNR